jgi:hypothetical protein
MQNYIADTFVKNSHTSHRHHIRKFMMPEKIRQWKVVSRNGKNLDPSLVALERLEASAPVPTQDAAPLNKLYETTIPDEL